MEKKRQPVELPGVAKKIAQARHFLGRAKAENENPSAVEADLMGFLSMAQAAFNRLEAEFDEAMFKRKHQEWWKGLTVDDQELIAGLVGERHRDVHKADPETTVTERKVRYPYRPQSPAFYYLSGDVWTITQEVHLKAADIPGCYKALGLFENFVLRFEEGDRRRSNGSTRIVECPFCRKRHQCRRRASPEAIPAPEATG
jgi:hypothetical protein